MTARYDRSPMEQCIAERDRFQEEVIRLRADLKRHKEALEKARVALVACQGRALRKKENWREFGVLTTINDLLGKGGQ